METIEVYRIENEEGIGPFSDLYSSFIPAKILGPMWNKLPAPYQDFEGGEGIGPYGSAYKKFEDYCFDNLKKAPWDVYFAFPSYEVFKEFVGDNEESIAEYVTTYKTNNYKISKSGLQVIFTKK